MTDFYLRSKITGTGLGVPACVLTNFDLEKIVETSDEWIRSRTGISERKIIDSKSQTNSSLSVDAAREAMKMARVEPSEIDLIIVCTATPNTWMPITASRVAGALGANNAGTFDLNAACSGFVTGLVTADSFIRSGFAKKVLVIGTDIFSTITDWKDRSTCVLFGDGSGAALLEATEVQDKNKDSMIIDSVLMSEFDENMNLAVLGGGSEHPYGKLDGTSPYITMNGAEVFKTGTRAMALAAKKLLEKTQMQPTEIDWLIPHQANRRIIEMVAKLLDFPMEKTFMNVEKWGNTSAGTVAICLAEMNRAGLLKRGQNIMLVAFGGGFTYGATLIRW